MLFTGCVITKNRYVLTGATLVAGAFNKVTKVAQEVGQKAKEKAGLAEEEEEKKKKVVDDEVVSVHLSESPKGLDQSKIQSSPKCNRNRNHIRSLLQVLL